MSDAALRNISDTSHYIHYSITLNIRFNFCIKYKVVGRRQSRTGTDSYVLASSLAPQNIIMRRGWWRRDGKYWIMYYGDTIIAFLKCQQ